MASTSTRRRKSARFRAGQRQLTEIVKAISRNVRVLILDEPTTALSGGEVEKLFTFLRKLKSEGVAIIYVSHRMDEITQIADRATILRDGKHVVTAPMSELTLGQDHRAYRRAPLARLLRRQALSAPRAARRCSKLREPLRPSEAGQRRSHALRRRGRRRRGPARQRTQRVGARAVRHRPEAIGRNPRSTACRSRSTAPRRDRARASRSCRKIACGRASCSNIRSRPTPLFRSSTGSPRGCFVSSAKAAEAADRQIEGLRIKTASREAAVRTLSGGNQQKVVIGKWLNAEPDIFILDEPTGGVDIGSKAEIITLVRDLAARGKAILVISSELSELLTAADRILVMVGRTHRQRIAARDDFDDPNPADDVGEQLQYAERKLSSIMQKAHAHV